MRVLQVDSGREWRGGQSQVRLLCRELNRTADVELRLTTGAGSLLAQRAAADGVRVSTTGWTMGLDPRALWRLVHDVRRFRPQVLHAHDSHALLLGLLARRIARVRPRAAVVGYRLVDYPVRRGSTWSRADCVAAVSEAVKRVLVTSGIPADRVAVIPPGIDPVELRQAAAQSLGIRARLGLSQTTPLALNLGALVEQKDQLTLIRAAAAARAPAPELHWAIAGEGELRTSLEDAIRSARLEDRVHLLGHIDGSAAAIRECDIVVLSSKAEGLPNVVLEALALGRPVVSTRAGGVPEALPETCLVPIGDAQALADTVARILRQPVVVPLLPRFTVEHLAREFLALYRRLI